MLISAPGLISGIRFAANANVVSTTANISNAQFKFGDSSFRNPGNAAGYANIQPANILAFGNSNYTIEFWFYSTSTATQGIIGARPQSTNGAYISIAANYPSAGIMEVYVSNGVKANTLSNAIVANTWTNFALVKNSGNTRFYVNGNQSGTVYLDTTTYLSSRVIFGTDDFTPTNIPLNGYIDELRISNIARYTGNYTVATQPFIDDANTLLLYHFDQGNTSRNLVDDNS